FGELYRRIASAGLTARLLLATTLSLAFAKNFFERPHLGKEHIAACAPALAVRIQVVGPYVPRDETIGLQTEVFEAQGMLERALLFGGNAVAKFDELHVATGDRITQSVSGHAEVVPDGAFESDFLQGGGPNIAARRGEFEFRGTVFQRLENKLGG